MSRRGKFRESLPPTTHPCPRLHQASARQQREETQGARFTSIEISRVSARSCRWRGAKKGPVRHFGGVQRDVGHVGPRRVFAGNGQATIPGISRALQN